MANEVEQIAPKGHTRVMGVKKDGTYILINDFPKREVAFRVINDMIRFTHESVGTQFYAYDDCGVWLRGPKLPEGTKVP